MASKVPGDAIALLKEDHAKVKELFSEFKRFQEAGTDGVDEIKQALMDEVCSMLRVHTQIEEEIFYPAAREALGDEEDLMNEAEVEHAGAKDLIAQIEAGNSADPMTCARFMVLSEQIDHHVKEEHDEMFPKIERSDMDTVEVGKQLAKRKAELESRGEAIRPSAAPGRQTGLERGEEPLRRT